MLNEHSNPGRIVLGCLLYTAGSSIQYVLPAYLTELSTHIYINEAQMGSISVAENIGITLASVLSMLWLARLNRRLVAGIGAVFCATFNLLSFFGASFEWVIVARFLTGFLGEGLLFALAFLVLGSTRDPDRSLGIGLTVVVVFGSLVLGASDELNRITVGTGVLLPLVLVPLAVLLALRWMPARPANQPTTSGKVGRNPTDRLAIFAIAGMAFWFAAPGAFWTFAESAAAARATPVDHIGAALAIGNAVGLLGSLMAAWQGARWGRAWPIVISTAGLGGSVAAFQFSDSVFAVAASLSAFNVFWNYGAVYEMALVTALDRAGRASLAISAAQVLGFAAGGFLSGLLIFRAGYAVLPTIVSALAVLGLGVLAFCFRMPIASDRG